MNTWIIVYIIVSALLLILLAIIVFRQQSTISALKEYIEPRIHSLVGIADRTSKIEKAVEWFFETKGLKLERRPSSCEWTVMPTTSPEYELNDLWRQIQMHREEIVYALYEANKRALEDHDKEKEKKKGKKK